MEIYDHAVDQYIERIIKISLNDHTRYHRKHAKEMIRESVENPDLIYHKRKEMPQVHIKDELAVVVGVRMVNGEQLMPYDSMDQDVVVPTVYHSNTFMEDENAEDEKMEA